MLQIIERMAAIMAGMENRWKFVLLIWCCHNLTYYFWALPCQWMYSRDWFRQWKVKPNARPSDELISDTWWKQLLARLLVHPFLWLGIYDYIIPAELDDPLPPVSTIIFQLLAGTYGFFAVNSIVHRMVHKSPWLYGFHKHHHDFKTTTGQASEHFDPYMVDTIMNM